MGIRQQWKVRFEDRLNHQNHTIIDTHLSRTFYHLSLSLSITTLIITYRSGGAEFSRTTAKSLLLSGLINVILYTIIVRYLFLPFGLFWGTGTALLISAGTGYLTYLFMKANIS